MPIYNNPQVGKAFDNLAQIFAPPSSSDVANYARAGAINAEAQRLADLYAYATDPNFNQTAFDRRGQAAGRWTPSTGYYGVDTAAATSRSNNAADNARALEERKMQEAGAMARLYASPVIVGNNQAAYIPAPTQGPTGFAPILPGNVTLNPGEQATLPDGRVIAGAPKAPTKAEVEGAILSGLPAADQKSAALASVPVESIIMDGRPVIVPRDQAYGQQPVPPAGARPEVRGYREPNGKTGMYVVGLDGIPLDAQTRQPLPQGSVPITINAANLSDAGVKLTEQQASAVYAGTMSAPATEDVIAAFSDPAKLPTAADYQIYTLIQQLPAQAAPLVGMMTPQGQKFYQDIRSALPYQLMAQSGQAVTEQEYARKLAELVPVPGEDTQVTAGKRRQFIQYQKAIAALAGPGAKMIDAPVAAGPAAPSAAPATPKVLRFDAQGNLTQ